MQIVDLSQVLFATFFASVGNHTNVEIEEGLVRHMALNKLRDINKKFRNKYGEMVIAADSTNNWRKEYFPYYKANRKKDRDSSDMDWGKMFECMNSIRQDIRDNFPYNYIQVDCCEADDIIGVIVNHVAPWKDDVLIVSGDKDFKQLHRYDSVKQYDPVRKRFLTVDCPDQYLFEHILSGDKGDGIPNILSDDNCLVLGERQKVLTSKRKGLLEGIQSRFDDKYYRNWVRNKTLIDLNNTPEELKKAILEQYDEGPVVKGRGRLLPFMMKHKMRNLIEHIGDF